MHLVDVLHLVRGHFEDPAHAGIGGNLPQRMEEALAQPGHGIAKGRVGRPGEGVFQRQDDTLHHGVEEVGLVLEVPVDGTTGQAGSLGDVVQGGARNTLLLKDLLCRVQNVATGDEGVFFRAANHGAFDEAMKEDRRRQRRWNIHTCAYVYWPAPTKGATANRPVFALINKNRRPDGRFLRKVLACLR
jgi:hypothetical protein